MDFPTAIRIPEPGSLPLKHNSLYSVAKAPVDGWCIEYVNPQTCKAREMIIQSDFVFLAAMCYPDVQDLENFSLVSTFLAWWFCIDDRIDKHRSISTMEMKTLAEDHKRILQGTYQGSSIKGKDIERKLDMFNKLCLKLTSKMTNHQQERFVKVTCDTFDWFLVEVNWRETNKLPTTEEYLWLRRGSSAVIPMIVLIEFARGINLSDELLHSAEVKRLEEIGIEHVMLSNDVMSFNKEWRGGSIYNMVPILASNTKCGIQEAVNKTCDMLKNLEDEYVELCKMTLEKHGSGGGLKEYVEGIGTWLSGNEEWGWITARYFALDWSPPPRGERHTRDFKLGTFGTG